MWILALLRSRKFWLSLVGLISVVWVALGNDELPVESLVDAIVTIVGVLVAAIAVEDTAAKLRG